MNTASRRSRQRRDRRAPIPDFDDTEPATERRRDGQNEARTGQAINIGI